MHTRPFALLLLAGLCLVAIILAGYRTTEGSRAQPTAIPTDTAALAGCRQQYIALQTPPAAPPADTVDPVYYADYNQQMLIFLQAGCHLLLEQDPANRAAVRAGKPGWLKDKYLRDTGPFVDDQALAVHPAVFLYYDPVAAGWLMGGRQGQPPDGAFVIKAMYAPPAAQYDGTTIDQIAPADFWGWSIMLRAAAASKDGWYWGGFDSGPLPTLDAYPFQQYPYAGFGQINGCLRCHASAAGEAFTFSSLRNIEFNPLTPATQHDPLIYYSDNSWLTPTPAPSAPNATPEATPVAAHRVNYAFLGTFPQFANVPVAQVTPFPPAIYDALVADPQAQHQFLPSSQCRTCHGGLAGKPFGPNMYLPNTDAESKLELQALQSAHIPGSSHSVGTDAGINLSPPGEWQWSMMGLAGRDPVFHAQLEGEGNLHPQHNIPAVTQDTCLRCHGVMAQRQFHLDNPDPHALFAQDQVLGKTKYGALARDGISCMSCHQIADPAAASPPQSLAAVDTGRIIINPPQAGQITINGPFPNPKTLPMRTSLGMTPTYNPFIQQSELCASCHTIRLPAFDIQDNQIVNRDGSPYLMFEQTTYLEWLNSGFAQPRGKSCQDCHMPKTLPLAPADQEVAADRPTPLALEYEIASIQSQRYPAVDNLAPVNEVTVKPRPGFARHSLHGVNLFVLAMFDQFDRLLGVGKQDYMTGSTTDLDFAALDYVLLAEEHSARVTAQTPTIATNAAGQEVLRTQVVVQNLTGHRFPSGVGFRRAFLQFQVIGGPDSAAAGEVVWASGSTNGVGVIVDGEGQPLPSEFFTPGPDGSEAYEPHYQVITNSLQVQIYEELTQTPEGKITSSFISRCHNLKDNRLLPTGWSKTPAGFDAYSAQSGSDFLDFPDAPKLTDDGCDRETALEATYPRGVDGDRDYLQGGQDTVVYEIALADIGHRSGVVGSESELVAAGRKLVQGGSVEAALYYQAIPPHYLAQRFVDGRHGAVQDDKTVNTRRLYYLASNLALDGTPAAHWKLAISAASQIISSEP